MKQGRVRKERWHIECNKKEGDKEPEKSGK